MEVEYQELDLFRQALYEMMAREPDKEDLILLPTILGEMVEA